MTPVLARAKKQPTRFVEPDAGEIERFLDYVAGLMTRNPREARLLLPVWRTLEKRLEEARDGEAIIRTAHMRLKQLSDRTAAQS